MEIQRVFYLYKSNKLSQRFLLCFCFFLRTDCLGDQTQAPSISPTRETWPGRHFRFQRDTHTQREGEKGKGYKWIENNTVEGGGGWTFSWHFSLLLQVEREAVVWRHQSVQNGYLINKSILYHLFIFFFLSGTVYIRKIWLQLKWIIITILKYISSHTYIYTPGATLAANTTASTTWNTKRESQNKNAYIHTYCTYYISLYVCV